MEHNVIVITTGAFTAAKTELEIIRSTASTIKINQKFADNARLNVPAVPAGAEIDVFRTPCKTTHTIKGPYNGHLDAYLNPCPTWRATLGLCKPDNDNGPGTGGTRGLSC